MSYHKGIWDALDCIEDESLQALAEATKGRMTAQGRWERELREARKSHSLRVVATAAGVSHARVAQILKTDGFADLTLRCPECNKRADMCFAHGDDWKKRA